MLLILNNKNIDINKVFFGDKSVNNVIDNSFFYQIYYSNDLFTLSSLIFEFNISNISFSECYGKQKITFDYNKNNYELDKIINLEKSILYFFMEEKSINTEYITYKIEETLKNNYIKINIDNTKNINKNICKLLIKISGIWENNGKYGIIYKFILK